ncbi:UNVERIFIED_CONTAM: DNA-binding SARP family transcriptional activator [Streptomyces canus]
MEALLARNEGDYLPDRTAQWVAERRRELSRQTADALSSAAEPALRLHQYGDTVRLCEQAIAIDPLRGVAWRVRMCAANVLGDDDGVLTAFQGCETALPQIDATPSPSTRCSSGFSGSAVVPPSGKSHLGACACWLMRPA